MTRASTYQKPLYKFRVRWSRVYASPSLPLPSHVFCQPSRAPHTVSKSFGKVILCLGSSVPFLSSLAVLCRQLLQQNSPTNKPTYPSQPPGPPASLIVEHETRENVRKNRYMKRKIQHFLSDSLCHRLESHGLQYSALSKRAEFVQSRYQSNVGCQR